MCAVYLVFIIISSTSFVFARSLEPPERGFSIIDTIFQGVNQIASFFQDAVEIVISQAEEKVTNITCEDAHLNISELASKYGYPLEIHSVITEDGYMIDFHRIPRGRTNVTNNLVVFLMHGIIESSDSWILQGPDKALGYILADQGFDVWMGNARGNKHANNHVSLNNSEPGFWQFTWEEIGIYDLPSMIDYTLNFTNQKSLYFVGYSQGTTNFYVLNSLKPEYNEKIKMMFSLAPVAWMAHVRSPLVKMFSPAFDLLGYFLLNYNMPSTEFLNSMSETFCSAMGISCNSVLYMIVGHDSKNLKEIMPVMLGHMPSTSSTLQLIHYGQLVKSGRFCQFDHGEERNLEVYGAPLPPEYNLTSVTVPNVLFFSENDWLADPADVDMLKIHLPNIFDSNYIIGFNHLDPVYAAAAKDIVYSKIVRYILEFENRLKS